MIKIINNHNKRSSFSLPLMAILLINLNNCAMGQNINSEESKSGKAIICGTYPASGKSVQSGSILSTPNECVTIITAGAEQVKFTSSEAVILKPGFIAQEGCNFIAYIESFSNVASSQDATNNVSEFDNGYANDKLNSRTDKEGFAQDISTSVVPNPFHSNFEFTINLNQDENAKLILFNSSGVKIKELSHSDLSKGSNKLFFDCSDLAPGVYMIEINIKDSKAVKRIIKI